MNQVTEERKDAVTKTLAIIGFVAAILFAVWLAVQIVSVIPSAFSSLASIADGVYNYNPKAELIVVNETTVANVGEAFTISWSDMTAPGVYEFTYDCTDGAAVSLRMSGDIIDLNCGETMSLGDKTAVEVVLESEKQRFIDVPYSISFIPELGDTMTTKSKVTVVNATIPTSGLVEDEVAVDEGAETETEATPTVAGENTSETNVAVTPTAPEVIEEIIYAIPTSDPNGVVDLKITYLGVGILTSDNKFVKAGTISTDQTGAFQFEVKNLGTKTSDTWTYEAKLPSQIDYDSSKQKSLKPNERAIITIGFDGISQTGTETFGVKVLTDNDVDSSNNSFVWAVNIVE